MTDMRWTIRQMCATFDVTPRALRFYEARELLFPDRDGQHRLFTRADRARLKLILRGKRFGFSLEQIRQLLAMYNRDDSDLLQLRRACELAQERIAEMERQRAELEAAICDLRAELSLGEAMFRRAGLAVPAPAPAPAPAVALPRASTALAKPAA